jgi:hypothetical protein
LQISSFLISVQAHTCIEADCCDGSDEQPGVCPNRCTEIGEAYRAKRNAELKIQKTGSKIRSTYIAFAHKEQKRLQEEVKSLEKEIVTKEKEVERLRGAFWSSRSSMPHISLLYTQISPNEPNPSLKPPLNTRNNLVSRSSVMSLPTCATNHISGVSPSLE